MTDSKETAVPKLSFTPTSTDQTKAGRVRQLYEEIQQAHAKGFQYEKIVAALKEQKLELTARALRQLLWRARASREKKGVQPAPKKNAVEPAAEVARKPDAETSGQLTGVPTSGGYRQPLQTFSRDVTKRRKWD